MSGLADHLLYAAVLFESWPEAEWVITGESQLPAQLRAAAAIIAEHEPEVTP